MADAAHWDDRYETSGSEQVSWYQPTPTTSIELLTAAGVTADTSVLDVGGGASTLVDHLLAAGHTDLTVLDLSTVALAVARDRLGDPAAVSWIAHDLLAWQPTRRWDAWHDRAVLHFLIDDHDRAAYVELLRRSLHPGGVFVIGAFAQDGPTHCSGLPVRRYGPGDLAALVGDADVIVEHSEIHRTPNNSDQHFNWIAARMQ